MSAVRQVLGFSLLMMVTQTCVAAPADSKADEDLLKAARIGSDGPELLAYFRQRTVGEAERQRILALIRQLGNDAYAVRERAVDELVEVGLPAVGLLRQGLSDQDVEIARRCDRCLQRIERNVPSTVLSAAAARLVAVRKPAGAAAVLLAYLPFADDEAVADELREALAAVALPEGRPDPVLEAALDDPLAIRRAAAAESLIRTRIPSVVAAGRKALADANPDVRLRTALALVAHAKDRQAVPAMIKLLGELPQSAGWRVEEVLIRLAGDAAPNVSLGSEESSRIKCRDAWLAWWDKDGQQIDLARLDVAPPTLGYTLLIVRDARSISGRVMEVNAGKEILWKIEGLQMPVDAIVIGKDRVLIAEQQNNGQVSERDFRGNVIWSKQVAMPVGLQRLPNGNTLVISRNQIVEWNPERTPVYTYNRNQYDIVAATKLRSGEIIFLTSQGACIRLDENRREIKRFDSGRPYSFASIDALTSGRLLITQREAVSELDRDGKQGWTASVSRPTCAQRLGNGNTLVVSSGTSSISELDRSGRTVWTYQFTDGSFPFKARRR